MNIVKYLQNEDGVITKVEWQLMQTTDDDERGYEIDGIQGKWLTIVSTFSDDAGKEIISMNPFTNPGLANYTELTEQEVNTINEARRLDEEEANRQRELANRIESINSSIENLTKKIAKNEKILTAVKNNVIYDGDLELMTALHNFTEDSIKEDKIRLVDLKRELEELNGEQ